MHQDIIRYRTRPEQAAANEELIRAGIADRCEQPGPGPATRRSCWPTR